MRSVSPNFWLLRKVLPDSNNFQLKDISTEADADMALDPVMVYRAVLKFRLVHPESTLNKPPIRVVGNHAFIGQLGIGHISFETILDCILFKGLKVDTYGGFTLKLEVFIVPRLLMCFLLTFLMRPTLKVAAILWSD